MTSRLRVNMKCKTSTVDALVISFNFVGSERQFLARYQSQSLCQYVLTGKNDTINLKYQLEYPSNHTVAIPFKLVHF